MTDADPLLGLFAERVAALVADRVVTHLANGSGSTQPGGATTVEDDRLLTAAEVADRLGVKKRWVYEHAKVLPFRVELPGRAQRFSNRGLARWIAERQQP